MRSADFCRFSAPLLVALLVGCGSSSSATPGGDDAGVDSEIADSGGDGAGETSTEGVVSTDKGPVRGTTNDGVSVFYDIPYAAPPVGSLRFAPPKPAPAWTATRDATQVGLACPQGPDTLTGVPVPSSEDCLHLNVWSPKVDPAAKAPVMVFVHGGSFVSGGGNLSVYDGTNLAKRGVVVVTINYRLGALGFLAHPALSAEGEHKTSGNYGLLDQQAALAWVKANAAAFGGDPGNVTLFGESAGAISVCLHVVSPLAKGLFHKALSESGSCALVNVPLHDPGTPAEDSAEERGQRFAKDLGCTTGDVLACLRSKTPGDLLSKTSGGMVGSAELGFAPNVDGWVVPSAPRKLLVTGPANDVPYVMGTNADEATAFTTSVTISTDAQYQAAVNALVPAVASQLLTIYPSSSFASPKAAYDALLGDLLFTCPAREAAHAVSTRTSAWLYHFEHVTAVGALYKLGAFHASELWFVFGNFLAPLSAPTADERKLSDAFGGYWTQFAKSGDPSVGATVAWPKYDGGDQTLILDTTISVKTGVNKDRCDKVLALLPP